MTRPVHIPFSPPRFFLNYNRSVNQILILWICLFLSLVMIFWWRENVGFTTISLGVLFIGPVALPPILVRALRLRWECQMQDNRVSFVEVDEQHLRIVKTNGANLVFHRNMRSFAVLMFQERGQDRFCLEVSYVCHTPRCFFLGREKESAEMLLHSLGLPSFEPRCPVPNAQKNWEAIPNHLNEVLSKKKWYSTGTRRKKNRHKKPGSTVSKKEMTYLITDPLKTDATVLYSCLLEGKEIDMAWILFFGLIVLWLSVSVLTFFLRFMLPFFYPLEFHLYPWGLVLVFSSWAALWRNSCGASRARYRCLFRVTEKGVKVIAGYGSPLRIDHGVEILLVGMYALILSAMITVFLLMLLTIVFHIAEADLFPWNFMLFIGIWLFSWHVWWVVSMKGQSFFRVTEKNPEGLTWWCGTSLSLDYQNICFQKKSRDEPNMPYMATNVRLIAMDAKTGENVWVRQFDGNFNRKLDKDAAKKRDELLHILVETADRVLQVH